MLLTQRSAPPRDFAVGICILNTPWVLELSTESGLVVASQVGVLLQVERGKGVIVNALCIGTRRVPFSAVDGKPSVKVFRSKDLSFRELGQKVRPISLLIEGEGGSQNEFCVARCPSQDTYNPHPT